jgi:hypothetical protein
VTSQPVPDLAETCWNHYSFHKASNDFTTFNIWNQDDESRLGTNYESSRCLLLLFSVCIWLKFELARVVGSVDLLNSLQLCQDQHWKMSIQGSTVHNIARLWIMMIYSKHSHNSLSHIYIYKIIYIYIILGNRKREGFKGFDPSELCVTHRWETNNIKQPT